MHFPAAFWVDRIEFFAAWNVLVELATRSVRCVRRLVCCTQHTLHPHMAAPKKAEDDRRKCSLIVSDAKAQTVSGDRTIDDSKLSRRIYGYAGCAPHIRHSSSHPSGDQRERERERERERKELYQTVIRRCGSAADAFRACMCIIAHGFFLGAWQCVALCTVCRTDCLFIHSRCISGAFIPINSHRSAGEPENRHRTLKSILANRICVRVSRSSQNEKILCSTDTSVRKCELRHGVHVYGCLFTEN